MLRFGNLCRMRRELNHCGPTTDERPAIPADLTQGLLRAKRAVSAVCGDGAEKAHCQ